MQLFDPNESVLPVTRFECALFGFVVGAVFAAIAFTAFALR